MSRAPLILLLLAACAGDLDPGVGPDSGAAPTDAGTPADAGAPCAGDCGVTLLESEGACAELTLAGDGTLDWSDGRCLPRQTRLAGAVARHFTYTSGGDTRVSTGAGSYDGIGYVTTHYRGGGAIVVDGGAGTVEVLVAGPHHVIRRVTWPVALSSYGFAPGASLRLIVDWFFTTGRSHPVYAVTYDLSDVPAGVYSGDSRAPYGEIRFDGDRGGTVSGVGWGDRHRFVTLGEPLDKLNGWDYTAPNVVPYAYEWSSGGDAEMGLVQTEPQARKAAGGYWFYGAWGTRDDDGPMPEDWNWPFQLNQYSFAAGGTTTSTRLAWGMNFGAVGDAAYAELGEDPDNPPPGSPSGYPYQSYSTYVVLGRHSEEAVLAHVAAVEAATTRTTVTAAAGGVRAAGHAGAGRVDTVSYEPAGYDPIYGVWRLDADASGRLAATFHVDAGAALEAPVVAVQGVAATARVLLQGAESADGVHRSFDAATDTLWLTFRSVWRGDVELRVEP